MCKKQTSASHSATESEVISLDAGLRMDGLPALDLWDFGYWSAGNDSKNTKTHPSVHTGNWCRNPKHTQDFTSVVLNVDPSNTDFAHISLRKKTTKLCKDDHQRQKSDDKTRVSHPPSCSGLVTWLNQPGPKSPNQVCRIQKPTRRHFDKRQFHARWVAQFVAFFQIMNDTTFSCSHFSKSHSFVSAGKQSMPRRSQESSSPESPMVKAKACCLVSRESVCGRRGGNRSLKCRHGDRWEDLQGPLCAKLGI